MVIFCDRHPLLVDHFYGQRPAFRGLYPCPTGRGLTPCPRPIFPSYLRPFLTPFLPRHPHQSRECLPEQSAPSPSPPFPKPRRHTRGAYSFPFQTAQGSLRPHLPGQSRGGWMVSRYCRTLSPFLPPFLPALSIQGPRGRLS